MKTRLALGLGMMLVTGCESDPVQVAPDHRRLVGEWTCDRFPDGFANHVGDDATGSVSRMTLREDGTCTIERFPMRDPYRLEDIPTGTWSIIDGSMTPSGNPSVEIAGNFFQLRTAGGNLRLRNTISGKDRYFVEYTKSEQAGVHPP